MCMMHGQLSWGSYCRPLGVRLWIEPLLQCRICMASGPQECTRLRWLSQSSKDEGHTCTNVQKTALSLSQVLIALPNKLLHGRKRWYGGASKTESDPQNHFGPTMAHTLTWPSTWKAAPKLFSLTQDMSQGLESENAVPNWGKLWMLWQESEIIISCSWAVPFGMIYLHVTWSNNCWLSAWSVRIQ